MLNWLKRIFTGIRTDAQGNEFFAMKFAGQERECIRPAHPNDQAFLVIAQNAKMGSTTLPSGFTVPAVAGKQWVVVGDVLVQYDKP